jgi:deoxyadenosine/deoxycytidine kinase
MLDLMSQRCRRVSLEGIIGAGKSKFLAELKKQVHLRPDVELTVVDEPVQDWCKTCDDSGKSILEHFYDDTQRYSFMFQINALMTRYSATTEANDRVRSRVLDATTTIPSIVPWSTIPYVVLSERTIVTDCEVFAKMLRDDELMTSIEHKVYKNTFDTLVARRPEAAKMDGIIYIHTTPTEAMKRIGKRNYLCACQAAHDKWLSTVDYPVLIIDGGVDSTNPRYDTLIEIAEQYLTTTSTPRSVIVGDWQRALLTAEQNGAAIYEVAKPLPQGQEVEGVALLGTAAGNMLETISIFPKYLTQEAPF